MNKKYCNKKPNIYKNIFNDLKQLNQYKNHKEKTIYEEFKKRPLPVIKFILKINKGKMFLFFHSLKDILLNKYYLILNLFLFLFGFLGIVNDESYQINKGISYFGKECFKLMEFLLQANFYFILMFFIFTTIISFFLTPYLTAILRLTSKTDLYGNDYDNFYYYYSSELDKDNDICDKKFKSDSRSELENEIVEFYNVLDLLYFEQKDVLDLPISFSKQTTEWIKSKILHFNLSSKSEWKTVDLNSCLINDYHKNENIYYSLFLWYNKWDKNKNNKCFKN